MNYIFAIGFGVIGALILIAAYILIKYIEHDRFLNINPNKEKK